MTTITDSNIAQQLDLSQIELILPENTKSVVIYPTATDFPMPGREGRIYHSQDTHQQWLWDDALIDYRLMVETIDCGDFGDF
jgi:hypothetical protein